MSHSLLTISFAALLVTLPMQPALAATPQEFCGAVLAMPNASADALVVKGDCAAALQDYDAAIGHYRAALRLDPGNIAVRADLSSLLMLTGKVAAAMPVLQAAARTNPGQPEAEVLAAIGTQLAQGTYVPPPPGGFRGGVSLSRIYDSNINSGSGANTFDAIIAGTLLKLNVAAAAKGKPGWGTELGGQASYMHVLDADNALVLSGDVGLTIYDAQSRYNRLDAALGAGLVQRAQNLTWSVTPNMRLVWQDDALAQAGFYVDGRIQMALDAQAVLLGFGKLGYTIVPEETNISAVSGLAGGGFEYRLSDGVVLGAHLALERNGAAAVTQSFTEISARLFAKARLTDSLTLDLSYGYSYAAYDQTAPVFPTGRRDGEHEFSTGLVQDLSGWKDGLTLSARYRYQNVDSTLDFYDRDRHVVTTSVRYRF